MEFTELAKKYAIDPAKNAGLTVGEQFASLSGEDPKSFIMAYKDSVVIGGQKMQLQMGPGGIKTMGGLLQFNGFPMCLFPMMPQSTINPELVTQIIDIASVVGQLIGMYA